MGICACCWQWMHSLVLFRKARCFAGRISRMVIEGRSLCLPPMPRGSQLGLPAHGKKAAPQTRGGAYSLMQNGCNSMLGPIPVIYDGDIRRKCGRCPILSLVKRATRIRLYPTADQQHQLAMQFGRVRFVWNTALPLRKSAWNERRESLSIHTLITMIPTGKTEDHLGLKDADSQGLQMAVRNRDQAYTHFFAKRAQYPVFKKKHAARQTFAYPQRVRIDEGRIFLPKVGLTQIFH